MPTEPRATDASPPPAPLFDHLLLGVGAMKAGTTWLHALLRRHPGIFFTPEKEIHYFYARYENPKVLDDRWRLNTAKRYTGFDPATADAAAVARNFRWLSTYLAGPVDDLWFRTLFQGRRHETWVADFSNLNALLSEAGWRRVLASAGQVRVLYTLREPVAQIWSHVRFHLIMTGNRQKLEAWSADELAAFALSNAIWPHSDYAAAIRRMRAVLPAGALQIGLHHEMRAAPLAFLRRTEAFLGLPPHDYPPALLDRQVNVTPDYPMPAGMRDAIAPAVNRLVAELADLGIDVPEDWAVR